MIRTIYLDLDGVLADFVRGCFQHFGRTLPMADVGWNFYRDWGMTEQEFWTHTTFSFWAKLPWTPEGRDLLDGLRTLTDRPLVILTSPAPRQGCTEGKLDWLRQHLPDFIRQGRVFIGSAKHHLAAPDKLLIDDHDANVERFRQHGGAAVLVPRPWNARKALTCSEGGFDVPALLSEIRTYLEATR